MTEQLDICTPLYHMQKTKDIHITSKRNSLTINEVRTSIVQLLLVKGIVKSLGGDPSVSARTNSVSSSGFSFFSLFFCFPLLAVLFFFFQDSVLHRFKFYSCYYCILILFVVSCIGSAIQVYQNNKLGKWRTPRQSPFKGILTCFYFRIPSCLLCGHYIPLVSIFCIPGVSYRHSIKPLPFYYMKNRVELHSHSGRCHLDIHPRPIFCRYSCCALKFLSIH